MKLDPNTEMDRLLRRHSRREPSLSASSFGHKENGEDVSHLDADEMIAFAENALPAATRARYSNHLADCDSCRKLVTDLAVSAGVAAKIESQTTPQLVSTTPHISWRNRLGALFAPAALRYAASLVVLLGITFIAIKVFRGGREMTFSPAAEQGASNQQTAPDSNVQTPERGLKPPGTAPSATPADVQPDADPAQKKDASSQEFRVDGTETTVTSDVPKSGIAQTPVAGMPAEGPYAADGVGTKEAQNAQPSISDAKLPAARRAEAGKDKNEADEVATTSGLADVSSTRSQVESEAMAKSAPPPKTRDQSRMNEEQGGERKRSPGRPAASGGATAGSTLNDSAGREDRDKKQADRRAVGGKQFLRRGNAWVDTAYKSQPTINVRRGSEQYRALVADEPGLRSISNQFDGEVIVVWGGKAYRIQ